MKYRLYIDESGDHTFRQLDDPAKRYLCLMGVVIEFDHNRLRFAPNLEALKQKHFPYDHEGDNPVVLHRSDLLNRKGPFKTLLDPQKQLDFDTDLLKFLEDHEYLLIAVVIDKYAHLERYREAAYHPYHYCMSLMLERYCGLLRYRGASGDVIAEARGKEEDKQLRLAYEQFYENGTRFASPESIQSVLSSKEIKLKPKTSNIAGIQIADVVAHPCKQDVLISQNAIQDTGENFGKQIIQKVKDKYNRRYDTGEVEGYGRVFIP